MFSLSCNCILTLVKYTDMLCYVMLCYYLIIINIIIYMFSNSATEHMTEMQIMNRTSKAQRVLIVALNA